MNDSIFPRNSYYRRKYGNALLAGMPHPHGPSAAVDEAYRYLEHDRRMELDLLALENTFNEKMAETVKDQIESAFPNINVRISYERGLPFRNRLRQGMYDLAIKEEFFDHRHDFYPLFERGGERNYTRFHDDTLDYYLKAYHEAVSFGPKLSGAAQEIHRIVAKQLPYAVLFTIPERVYRSGSLEHVDIHPEVGFATVEEWYFSDLDN